MDRICAAMSLGRPGIRVLVSSFRNAEVDDDANGDISGFSTE